MEERFSTMTDIEAEETTLAGLGKRAMLASWKQPEIAGLYHRCERAFMETGPRRLYAPARRPSLERAARSPSARSILEQARSRCLTNALAGALLALLPRCSHVAPSP